MKRIQSAILVLILVFMLFGCQEVSHPISTQNETTSANLPSEPTAETTVQGDTRQLPLYAVSMPKVTETTTADDGKIVFRNTYNNLSLILPEAEVADKIIIDYLNQMDAASEYAQTAAEVAMDAYMSYGETNTHFIQGLYSPIRLDSSILSLYGDIVSYPGGAHPLYFGHSLNYDILSGNRLSLPDILQEGITVTELKEKIEYGLSLKAAQIALFPEYKDLLQYYIPSDLSECTNWYFSQNGLCFYFAPGEIGPASSRTIHAGIPYRDLTEVLKDAYFPTEAIPGNGTMKAQLFDAQNLTQFDQFSELVLNPGCTKIILSTNETVYDIKIAEVVTNGGNSIDDYHYNTLYAAHTLSPSGAILLESDFTATTLRLSYCNADGAQSFIINFDGNTICLEKP